MNLLNPLGLIGLLSIIVLIIIYIFKPKYQEKKISSTFIWKLSLNYKKRKLPLQWLQKSLLFIMQVLILTILSLLLAKPVLTSSLANGEKIIILDASASMQTINNNVTRFDKAVNEIKTLIDRKKATDHFTLIIAKEEASYLARREQSSSKLHEVIDKVNCTFESANIESAINLANSVLDENIDADVLLFSDTQYKDTGYIKLKNMASNEWNASILSFDASLVEGYYVFKAEIANYNKDEYLTLELYIDGIKQATKIANCRNNQVSEVIWDDVNILSYNTAYIKILDANDSFTYDNEFYLFSDREEFKVQLVSPSPIFLFSMLRPLGCKIDVRYTYDTDNFENIKYEGYDLYIFDSFELVTLPSDGPVWIINPIGNLPSQTELTVNSSVNGEFDVTYADNNTDVFISLTKDFSPIELKLTKYTKLSGYQEYETILNVENDPLILTRNLNGTKIIIFAFDLSYSNLPILFLDYAALIRNMKNYSLAYTSDKLLYTVCDVATISTKPNAKEIFLESDRYFNVFNNTPIKLKLVTPGVYETSQTVNNEVLKENFYVKVARSESDFATIGGVIAGKEYINIEKGIYGGRKNKGDYQELITYLAISILAFLIIEWGLQYRELF
jgi:flagellar motor component MotA